MQTYYQRILRLCKRKGINLEELAEETEISVRRLKCWNRYHIYPEQGLLDKIAAVLQVSPKRLDFDVED